MGLPPLPDLELPEIKIETGNEEEPQAKASSPKQPLGKRVTEGNARLLAFAAKFPGGDSETFSVLSNRQKTRFAPGGELPTIKGTEVRLRKLEQLGTLERYKNPATKTVHYGITTAGIGSAWSFGYNLDHAATIRGISLERANHYRMIAHVAAQFASPEGFFRESLGVEPVGLDALISEHAMRGTYAPVKASLKAGVKKGESADFGKWREDAMQLALLQLDRKRISFPDILESNPALLTVGQPQRTGTILKAVYQPDLAVILDHDRTNKAAKNLLVEVELSKKSWEEYTSILATIASELKHGFVYDRAVYFTVGSQVETLLRKVDKKGGWKLFETGKLTVLPLLHRDGTPVSFSKRITIGGN